MVIVVLHEKRHGEQTSVQFIFIQDVHPFLHGLATGRTLVVLLQPSNIQWPQNRLPSNGRVDQSLEIVPSGSAIVVQQMSHFHFLSKRIVGFPWVARIGPTSPKRCVRCLDFGLDPIPISTQVVLNLRNGVVVFWGHGQQPRAILLQQMAL